MMESNNTKTRKTMRKRNEPKRTIVKNRMMEMAKANNQMTRKMRGGKIVSNLPAQFFQQSDGKFESFEENVKEASQKKILKEAEGKSLIAAYPGSYFKTGNCVDDMCSTEELTTACMNSLGIVTLEHQDYEDYKKVMELYDKMSEEEQKAVVEANLLSLRTYLADLFKKESGQDDLLTDEKKLALKAMLETINPFYYNYLIFTDKLPEPMRTAIYEEMLQTRNLKDPLELLKLFLNYYNTVNPYRMKGAVGSDGDDMVGKRLNEYLYDNFKVSEISPSPYSAHRYNDLEIWDLEGILRTVSVPMYKMERGKELVKVIQETYGDSFKRPNPLWLIKNNPEWKIGDPESKKTIDYWVDMRYGMEQIEVNDVSEYADRAFYDFMELLARKAGVPKAEWPTNEQIKDVTRQEKIPEEGSAMYKWIELPLVRKVFAVLGISIYYRFFNVFEVGSLGGENFEDKKLLSGLDYGLFGYFSTANLRYEFECGHINITNLKDDYKINMGEAAALRLFLKQRAPMYFDRYPEAFLTKTKEGESSDDGKEVDLLETHPGERPDSLRVIRLDQDNAVTINIYEAKIMIMDEGEYMYMALIVEVNIYRNVDNTENPMDVTTDFLILWRNQKEDEAEMAFENNCKGLYEMLMKGVWSSMKKTGVIPPLEKISINPEVEERGIAEEKGENIEEGVSEEKSEVSQEKEPQSEPKGEVTDSVQEIEEEGEEETKETSPDSISGSDSKLEELTEEDFRVDHTTPFMELMEQEEDSDSESESDESVTREEEVNQEEEFTPLPRPDLPEKSPLPSSLKKPNEIPTRKNRSMMDRFRSNPNNKTKKVRVETFRNKEYPPPVN